MDKKTVSVIVIELMVISFVGCWFLAGLWSNACSENTQSKIENDVVMWEGEIDTITEYSARNSPIHVQLSLEIEGKERNVHDFYEKCDIGILEVGMFDDCCEISQTIYDSIEINDTIKIYESGYCKVNGDVVIDYRTVKDSDYNWSYVILLIIYIVGWLFVIGCVMEGDFKDYKHLYQKETKKYENKIEVLRDNTLKLEKQLEELKENNPQPTMKYCPDCGFQLQKERR